MRTHLVVPDTHCKPGENYERFKWLGRLIGAVQPEVIVFLGDHWDMPSLCSHDNLKADFKKRSFNDDVNSGVHAFEVMWDEAFKFAGDYTPETYLCGGNHDDARIERILSEDARFEEYIPRLDVIVADRVYLGDLTYVPYQSSVKIDGINYSHNFPSGIMNRPIGGEHPASSLLNKLHQSCVAGHQHIYDYSERTAADGSRLCGLVAGCFIDPKWSPSYAGSTRKMWRNGVSLLWDVKAGCYDLEFLSIERMKRVYG